MSWVLAIIGWGVAIMSWGVGIIIFFRFRQTNVMLKEKIENIKANIKTIGLDVMLENFRRDHADLIIETDYYLIKQRRYIDENLYEYQITIRNIDGKVYARAKTHFYEGARGEKAARERAIKYALNTLGYFENEEMINTIIDMERSY